MRRALAPLPAALTDNRGYNRKTRFACPWRKAKRAVVNQGEAGFVERQNLTMRMQMRRFTPLTNAFSKKIDNLGHAVALHFMHYNFCRVHQTLRVTPAMEAGVANHVWTIDELVKLLDSERFADTKSGA